MAEFLSINSTYTGGAVILQPAVSGAWTLDRAVSGNTFVQIASGNYMGTGVFIDTGDGLPGPLDPTAFYLYQLTDVNGTVTSPAIQPSNAVNLDIEPLTSMLIRLLQGAINGIVADGSIPPGVAPPNKVLLAMPIGGLPALPIITINLDLLQQTEIPIGQSFPFVNQRDGSFVLIGNAKRVYTISVLASDALTRDFYREAIARWWLVIVSTVLTKIGQNVGHRYQVASGQVAKDEKMPGFYYSDLMVELNGAFNVDITPSYGLIETITISTGSTGLTDEIIVA